MGDMADYINEQGMCAEATDPCESCCRRDDCDGELDHPRCGGPY
jgi:hypothetical protein